jgi:hypothetical protein
MENTEDIHHGDKLRNDRTRTRRPRPCLHRSWFTAADLTGSWSTELPGATRAHRGDNSRFNEGRASPAGRAPSVDGRNGRGDAASLSAMVTLVSPSTELPGAKPAAAETKNRFNVGTASPSSRTISLEASTGTTAARPPPDTPSWRLSLLPFSLPRQNEGQR